ncbi:mitochondrial matrix Mmp37 [Syncephalis fuscata]|nr:mitochondrial matrix Mmp37 [Syncephalis fuscata]
MTRHPVFFTPSETPDSSGAQHDFTPAAVSTPSPLITIDSDLKRVLDQFRAPVRFAFAYGSGVFRQRGYNYFEKGGPNTKTSSVGDPPLVDLIFAVSHPAHWHSVNLQQHPEHYGGIVASLGSSAVTSLQENFGAGIWFNPFVTVEGIRIKYGVISVDTLCQDLLEWETLYLAGRMQKPLRIIKDDYRVRLANRVNRLHAMRAALLLLPNQFTTEELFMTVAGLSFTGDFRMQMGGEHPDKVANIVRAQIEYFRKLYAPIIQRLDDHIVTKGEDRFEQNDNPEARAQLIRQLPERFYQRMLLEHKHWLVNENRRRDYVADEPKLSQAIAQSPALSVYVRQGIHKTVRWPAISQSLKGVVTAGIVPSIRYGLAKLRKGVLRR